jgi:hypothetical protein
LPELVCFGVGGTGAACIEATLHLAALGLFNDCRLTVCIIDADLPHPRSVNADQFARRYEKLRELGKMPEGWHPGFLGTPVESLGGALRPSGQSNLFSLLGLSDARASSVARLFFAPDETSRDNVFQNGYYGRTNAGVCFFSDHGTREKILTPLHPALKGARVVIFGSNFGGTGAAGMIDLARALKGISAFTAAEQPKIALVQMEPYFRPDDSHLGAAQRSKLISNDPRTFERRAATSYQFLDMLQQARNLPYDVFYPLGTPTPAKFPADAGWFQVNSQNNPPLFPEYLAALAAADFLGRDVQALPISRKRQVPVAPFSGSLDGLRKLLFAATFSQMILERYVLPLIRTVRGQRSLPGHPWISDLAAESGTNVDGLFDHFSRAQALLGEILSRIGILETSTAEAQRREITLASFPDRFLVQAEHLNLTDSLAAGNPIKLFDDYDLEEDGRMPVRSLFRWVLQAQRVPDAAAPGKTHGRRDHQLFQQEAQPEHSVLGLPVATDDEFNDVAPAVNMLARLAGANWDRPANLASRLEWELPSVWATALAHRERLYGRGGLAEEALRRLGYLQLGLLWQVLMKVDGHSFAPIYPFPVQSLPNVFRDALQRTCPLGQQTYATAVDNQWRILSLYESSSPYPPDDASHPPADKVVGFFYPDTVVVPAAGLSESQAERFVSLGRFVAEQGFATFLLTEICPNWPAVLAAAGVPNAENVGQDFADFLQKQAAGKAVAGINRGDRRRRPVIAGISNWVSSLYQGA